MNALKGVVNNMALSNEDKKDVQGAMGKAIANKVSKVTRDRDGYYKGKLKAPSGKEFEITKPRSNPFGGGGSWNYGASASKASKDPHNALHNTKSKALTSDRLVNKLLTHTEGKYSGYSHHPDYKVGDDIRKKPASSKSKALQGKRGSFIDRLEAHKAEGQSFDNGTWKPKYKGQTFIQALEEHKRKSAGEFR